MTWADDRIFDQAAAWYLAGERDDMDWEGFTAWLEADSRHRTAYEEIALGDATLADHRGELAPFAANENTAGGSKWPLWAGGALAATLIAVAVVPQLTTLRTRTFTSGGEPRAVALGSNSHVILGPHSRLTVSGRHGEHLALEGGGYFTVRHDPDRSLTVNAGGLEVRDVGTRFDLQSDGDTVRVEVSEGEVEVRGETLGNAVGVAAGHSLLFDPAHHLAKVAPVSPQDVGEWREGRLTYDTAPLSLVAADLARYAGISVSVPPQLAARRFSGTLSIHDGDSAVRDLAQLMGLELSRRGGAYRLGERR